MDICVVPAHFSAYYMHFNLFLYLPRPQVCSAGKIVNLASNLVAEFHKIANIS